jgi:polysaccharide biosynthesis protein PelC
MHMKQRPPPPAQNTCATRRKLICGVSLLVAALAGCTTINVPKAPIDLDKQAAWGLLPIVNLTETPQAGLRAESIVDSLLRTANVARLRRYPASLNTESLLDPAERKVVDQALVWAKSENLKYGITGSVEEWRYKVGVDGEPAVGLTLQVVEIASGQVIWSASGSKTGWAREALSAVAQKLISELTRPLGTVPSSRSLFLW